MLWDHGCYWNAAKAGHSACCKVLPTEENLGVQAGLQLCCALGTRASPQLCCSVHLWGKGERTTERVENLGFDS